MSAPQPQLKVIKFERNAEFLGDNAAAHLEFSSIRDQQIALALVKNNPFPLPASGKIELGNIEARAEAGKEIVFKGRDENSKITFGAGGGAFVRMGVYRDPNELLAALDLDDSIAPGMALEQDSNSIYLALQSGYDLNAEAKGSIALGAPGALKFGVDAQREAAYAIVRRFAKDRGARDAVQDTVDSWMLPTQVQSGADLDPETWLIAEVDGAIGVKLGATYGYDFNWIREAKLGGITGDIGLRIQLGVATTLGFEASGKYAVVLSRDAPDPQQNLVRLRLFKQRTRGWNFAFNAGASVKADLDDFLPEQLDQFITSVFNIHGAQILKALDGIDKWTDPEKPVLDNLAEVSAEYAKKFLGDVTGIDPAQQFETARDRVKDFIDKWHDLDHRLATVVWKQVEEKVDLQSIRNLAARIASVNKSGAKEVLRETLSDVRFFDTPQGAWLEAAAGGGIMRALGDSQAFGELQGMAEKTLAVLDDSKVEAVLTNLQTYINQHFGLTQIEEAVDSTSYAKVDEWAKARLAAFLGVAAKDLQPRIVELRKAINTIRSKSREFYEAGRQALGRKYEAEFISTYQKETTRTALLDIVFDFNVEAAALDSVRQSLQDAVDGKFDALLVESRAGVSLNEATLTHQISRQSHVELSLPYFKSVADHINTSLAKVTAIEDDGRVLVYELEAEDIAIEKAKIYRNSHLTIGAYWPHKTSSDVRIHSTAALNYGYSFRQAKARMKRADLQYQLRPYITNYFPETFSASVGGDAVSGSYETWIGDMDRAIDRLPEGGPDNAGTDKFGNTLFALELSPESEVVSAWLQASKKEKKDPIYMEMSRRLQRRLRELVPFYYFQNPGKYKDLIPASTLLVYSSMPALTTFKVNNGKLEETNRDVYWDWPDTEKRDTLVRSQETAVSLIDKLSKVHSLLLETPGLEGLAPFYHPSAYNTVRRAVLDNSSSGLNPGRILLGNLLSVEASFVEGARNAAVELAKFYEKASSKPTEAIEALAKFGAKATSTFNSRLGGVFGGEALRPMGTMMFVEAALTLAQKPLHGDISAMLDLMVLKQNSAFALEDFIMGKNPSANDVLLQQRLVNL